MDTETFTRPQAETLPDFRDLWDGLPLPFTPAEAWRRLPVPVQAEIGTAVIAKALAEYIAGEGLDPCDRFLDADLRDRAWVAQDAILNSLDERLWGLLPELYGPVGDHPRWALEGGLAR